jgi:hypothetical protein
MGKNKERKKCLRDITLVPKSKEERKGGSLSQES